MKRVIIGIIILFTFGFYAEAQEFKLSADLKPRFEYRHGFGKLMIPNVDPEAFVSQRSRLIGIYNSSKVNFKISAQNVRVWGDVPTMTKADNFFKFHEVWGEIPLKEQKLWLRLGRQEFAYDDHRILGNVEWAQQARSHDAALLRYVPNEKHQVHFAATWNSNNENLTKVYYPNIAGYKTMQFLWYHGDFNENFAISFLALNIGREYLDTTNNTTWIDNMQTIGPRITYKKDAFKAEAFAYYQTGKQNKADVNAMDISAFASYTFNEKFTIGAGAEYLSGKATNDTTAEVKSFNPLFGTNHKFNGWMDYFYVGGRHVGNVGLMDIYFVLGYKKDKFSAKVIPHLFSSAADIYNGNTQMDNNLGTEIDFTFGYKINDFVTLKGGYSQMLATESLEFVSGAATGSYKETNNWAWLMFVIRPTLLHHKAGS